ncbi:hypothetical protein QJS83_16035 [Bdellovibrio sp. 22V]|uniref:hypothetical protein n=1 Tax=Bdellovibrio sp. 22V TaxID=3044166 RepID=UPI0025436886|nr:hypothetical protein [Bdellovibrio sp. 22V]WII71973.1 hypothetical protein QJS83_16035 [Bdellovibrio sp. 22V]
MIYYILKRNTSAFCVIVFGALLTSILGRYNDELGVAGVLIMMAAAMLGVKSNWCLLLPMSRKRIMAWSVVEAAIVASFSVLSLAVVSLVMSETSGIKISARNFDVGVVISIMIFLLRSLVGLNIKNVSVQQNQHPKTQRKTILFIFAFSIPALLMDRFPLLPAIAIFCVLVCTPLMAYQMYSPPIDSWRKIRNWSYAGCLSASVFLITLVYGSTVYWAPNKYTDLALGIWGQIPVPIPEERALTLLKSPYIGRSIFSVNLIKIYAERLTPQDITKRTEKCADRNCIEMSTLLYSMNSTYKEPDFETFKEIVEKCSLKESQRHLKCSNIKPHKKVLGYWLNSLASSEKLTLWLQSEDRDQQFLALRALSTKEADKLQLQRVEQLMKSDDKFIKSSATEYMKVFRAKAELNKDLCAKTPDDTQCRAQVDDLI